MMIRRLCSVRLIVATLLFAAAGLFSGTALSSLCAQDGSKGNGGASAAQNQGSPAATPDSGEISVPATLPKGKKLILKDGSFQMVREYSRQGERVRYYSVERSGWEEIPAALVDWDATQKADAEQEARDKDLVQKIKASELAARVADINSDRSLEVRPGVILPDEAGLYVVDGQKAAAMAQDLAVSRLNKGREIARIATGVPLISSKHFIEIPGKRAKLRIQDGEPEFYFRPVDGRDAHLFLLRVDVIGDKRQVESMSTNIADISTYKNHEVSLLAWEAARGVTRFTVNQKLEPGEYAMVENMPNGEVDLYVWDFGVDVSPAAQNPAP